MLKNFLIIILLFLVFSSFYKINAQNYEKHNEIKQILVNHPENLPKKEIAKVTSF
ncbi:MAG: hypothetical protein LBU14_05850 [Candidatus Peribacteria bacterium]|nr:hypothetical protein [Candidatus Peribacteria bacterium]